MRAVSFIFAPTNTGLKEYRTIALSQLADVDESKIVNVRGEDVAFWLEKSLKKGEKALGLTGEDLYHEYCLERRTLDIGIVRRIGWDDPKTLFGKPALCLIGPEDKDLESLPKITKVFISSKYKRVSQKYLNFLESRGRVFRKTYLAGCIETSCSQGLADLVIDIVYTGRTLREHGLKVFEVIMKSDFLILGKKGG